MSVSLVDSRNLGASVQKNVVAALNSMGAQPQGCYGATAPVPSLALDFLTQTLDPRITFSRASTVATRVNSAGLIETLGTDAPRFDYDPVTLAPRGLLIEEARTNLEFQNSLSCIAGSGPTSDGTLAPDGSVAKKWTCDGTNAAHYVGGSAVTVTATANTVSMYIKNGTAGDFYQIWTSGVIGTSYANFQLSTQTASALGGATSASCVAVGGGWYRVALTYTTAAASGLCVLSVVTGIAAARSESNTNAGTFYSFGHQVEAGAFPTSYIPTTTAAVTRAADVASMTGTNFSSWFNATEGTFVVAADITGNTAYGYLFSTTNNSINEMHASVKWNDGSLRFLCTAGGVAQFSPSTIAAFPITGVTQKVGYGFAANNLVATWGGTTLTDLTASLPTVDRLFIGGSNAGTFPLNGHIQRLTYFNKRLPDATLKALSA